jgi:hypothetical protein
MLFSFWLCLIKSFIVFIAILRRNCQEFCEAPAGTPAVIDAGFLQSKNPKSKNSMACGLLTRSFAKQNSQGRRASRVAPRKG